MSRAEREQNVTAFYCYLHQRINPHLEYNGKTSIKKNLSLEEVLKWPLLVLAATFKWQYISTVAILFLYHPGFISINRRHSLVKERHRRA
jgi:hypothetical protein